MIRAAAADNFVRAFAVTSRGVTEYARKRHNLSPVASAALGRTMAAGLMMGAMMKGEKDVLTLRFMGDGPLGGITVTAGPNGNVKGYVGNPSVVLPPNEFGHFDVGGAVGKGLLHVLRDLPQTVELIPAEQELRLFSGALQGLYNKITGSNITEISDVDRARRADPRCTYIFFLIRTAGNDLCRHLI